MIKDKYPTLLIGIALILMGILTGWATYYHVRNSWYPMAITESLMTLLMVISGLVILGLEIKTILEHRKKKRK